MRADASARAAAALALALLVASVAIAGCTKTPPAPKTPPRIYASAEEVELDFRSHTFVLGDDNQIAEVRPLDWPKNKFIKLPFWFGVNILVPGVMAPRAPCHSIVQPPH